ncbi:hypothetical protein, partial [Pantoea septica]|uniref:hypothetical protein n=1 Tax=Pantoea septica TaxID=472695 RepID=UPI0023F14AE8
LAASPKFYAQCTMAMHEICEPNHLFIGSAITQNFCFQYGRKFFCAVLNAFLFFSWLAYFLHYLLS